MFLLKGLQRALSPSIPDRDIDSPRGKIHRQGVRPGPFEKLTVPKKVEGLSLSPQIGSQR